MSKIEQRLLELGITLPPAPAPAANYVPYVRTGNLVMISGQVCFGPDGKLAERHKGKLGREVSEEMGKDAARVCGLNLIAQLKACVGDLDTVVRCVRLGGFVNVMPDYAAIPAIINGASDLMVEVFGEAGRHARAAVGVAELPFDCAVEIDAIFEIA